MALRHFSRFLSFRCCHVGVVALLAACSPAPAGRAEERHEAGVREAVQGGELRVTLSIPRRVGRGEYVPGTLTLYNPGRRAVEVPLPGRPDSASFNVVASGPDGREVWRLRPPGAPPAGEHRRSIGPGGSLAVTFVWPQRDQSGRAVPPGGYRLQGIFATSRDTLLSEPARVQVAP